MSTVLYDVEEVMDTDNPSNMVHLAEGDSLIAICGAKLRGIEADTEQVDCIVCAEIERQERESLDF